MKNYFSRLIFLLCGERKRNMLMISLENIAYSVRVFFFTQILTFATFEIEYSITLSRFCSKEVRSSGKLFYRDSGMH